MSTTPPSLTEIVMQWIANRTGRRVRNLTIEIGDGSLILRGSRQLLPHQATRPNRCREALPDVVLENAITVE